jgi:hypothetical protein
MPTLKTTSSVTFCCATPSSTALPISHGTARLKKALQTTAT